MFKVAIIGGDGFEDYELFEQKCIKYLRKKGQEGCGIMVYTTGEKCNDKFSYRFGIDIRYFICNWKRDGNDALKFRNEEMLSDVDAVIAFDDGLKDTQFFLEMAKAKKIPYRFVKKEDSTESTS